MAPRTSNSVPSRRKTSPSQSPPDEVSALARGLLLLRVLAEASAPLTNRAFADATGIPKATISRLTATLSANGFLHQDESSERFDLGPALLDLSNAYLRSFDMRALCRPYLTDLANRSHASVHLGIRDGLDILVIDTLRPRSAVILTRTDIGTRMDIATSSSGRAYFTALTPEARQELLDTYRRSAPKRWPAVRDMLSRAVVDVERCGYGSSFQEWHRDINAIGFTLRGPRGELYAVSCGGPACTLPPETLTSEAAPAALAAQRAVALACGSASFNPTSEP